MRILKRYYGLWRILLLKWLQLRSKRSCSLNLSSLGRLFRFDRSGAIFDLSFSYFLGVHVAYKLLSASAFVYAACFDAQPLEVRLVG
jgi:hypothetical protein